MKTKHLIIINVLTFLFFSVYFYLNTTDCEAYFMHDASIDISAKSLITTCSFFFIGPAIIQLLQKFILKKENVKILIVQYILGLTSIGLLALSINKPCEFINGGHYMFANAGSIGLSYLLRLIFYLVFGLTFIWTIINLIMPRTPNKMKK